MHIPAPTIAKALFLGTSLLAGVLAGMPAAWAASGMEVEPAASRLQADLTLTVWGLPVGKMDLDASIKGADYHAVSHFKTSGLARILWPTEISATSFGKVGPAGLKPVLYDSFDTGRGGKKQQVSLSYDGDAPPRLHADPVYATTGYDVKPDDIKATLDPLSAVMLIASGVGAGSGNPCALTVPVFDGRRRYNVEMTRARDMDIRMDNGLYQGKGVQCDIRYHQIAGFRPQVIRDNESFPVLHAWIVAFPSAVTGRDYTVPVRVWADTRYGTMAVRADSVRVDGTLPKGVKP